jgi:ribosomal protein S18 acetylase RimI-like enzyme
MEKIRRGTKFDIDNYLKFQLEAFPDESIERHRKYFLQKIDRDEILIFELDSIYIGHLSFSKLISCPFPNTIYAEEFVIGEKYRNKKFGKKLMVYLIKEARKNDFNEILLNTSALESNKAISFYQKHGFKKIGVLNYNNKQKIFFQLLIDDWI